MAQVTQELKEVQAVDLGRNNKTRSDLDYMQNFEPLYKAPEPPIEDYPLAMPRESMYGYLGERAKTLQMPLSWAYPSLLTIFCATGINLTATQYATARPTLYTALIGQVSDGKSKCVERARDTLALPAGCIKYTTLGSDKGLSKVFGGSDKKDEPVELKAYVLIQDELRALMSKAAIQNSALPATLCTLWNQDEAGSADKSGDHTVNVRLSILGSLKISDTTEFSNVFGAETQGGLYDRFLFAPGPTAPWVIDMRWRPEPEYQFRPSCGVVVPDWCWTELNKWKGVAPTRRRLGELAMRVAIISASANQDHQVTRAGLQAAFCMMEWQERVREVYRPGSPENPDAQCTSAILDAIKAAGNDEDGLPKWVKQSVLARQNNWYRKFGGPMINRVFASLRATGGPLVAKYHQREGHDGKLTTDYSSPTGEYRLKGAFDDDAE
jgi:hypothetical protein